MRMRIKVPSLIKFPIFNQRQKSLTTRVASLQIVLPQSRDRERYRGLVYPSKVERETFHGCNRCSNKKP